MELRAELDARCRPDELFAQVERLDAYPTWMGLVARVDADPSADPDTEPAWSVTLRARIGPLARSKRLRMVRTVHRPPVAATFERREADGRDHAPWVMTVRVTGAQDATSTLHVDLRYGGRLWVPMLDRLLAAEIDDSRERLRRLVEAPSG